MNAGAGTEYRVQARNLSHASENRIHDDAVARRFGFQGALVPGVELYAYLTHLPAARWGLDWLEHGSARCRFGKPVYDGRMVAVTARPEGDALALELASENVICASGAAALPQDRNAAPPIPEPARVPAAEARPDPDETTLAVGRRLSSSPLQLTAERLRQYLGNIGETEPLYAREHVVHPAFVLRLANFALKENVKLAAWIHTGSAIRHYSAAHAGETLAAHATVAANYERKGHRCVDLDVIVVAQASRVVAQVRHTAIYRLKHNEEE